MPDVRSGQTQPLDGGLPVVELFTTSPSMLSMKRANDVSIGTVKATSLFRCTTCICGTGPVEAERREQAHEAA